MTVDKKLYGNGIRFLRRPVLCANLIFLNEYSVKIGKFMFIEVTKFGS